ncbi:MAG: flavodoxin family protein [Planctomycetes bacterium]|nr:flavodoxin family protein [Planctomycetota bacterium]
MTKILAVRASARRGGNSDTALEKAINGMRHKDPDAKVEILTAYGLPITPCRSCNGCWETGRCVVQDEMQDLYTKFSAADHIIVTSPIYFTSLPGHMKVLIDRFQCFWVRTFRLKDPPEPHRTGAFLCIGAMDRERYFQSTLTIIKSWFAALNVECAISHFYSGLDAADDILEHEDYLEDARQTGIELLDTN